MSFEREKQLVANEAVKLVESGMKIGIGTGSTIHPFIEALIGRVEKEGLEIECVATSIRSKSLVEGVIPLLDESLEESLDLTFDGADRVDRETFYLIKGGGGALLREKLVAKRSKKNVVLIDASKLTSPLAGFPVALEIVPFGVQSTIDRIYEMGYQGKLRRDERGRPILSDNQNYLFDIEFIGSITNPLSHHNCLKGLLGVIETGFFLDTAHIIYIGYPDGRIKILEKKDE